MPTFNTINIRIVRKWSERKLDIILFAMLSLVRFRLITPDRMASYIIDHGFKFEVV